MSASAWLGAPPAPATWPVARIPSGAKMPYPPGWHLAHGDRGTATVVLLGARGLYVGYLNVTPRQGGETLANWSSFRVDHNREEGDRHVQRLASAQNLAFGTGRGSCVKDAYVSSSAVRYIEVACLVRGSRSSVVVVGAAPPSEWRRLGGDIARAIGGVSE